MGGVALPCPPTPLSPLVLLGDRWPLNPRPSCLAASEDGDVTLTLRSSCDGCDENIRDKADNAIMSACCRIDNDKCNDKNYCNDNKNDDNDNDGSSNNDSDNENNSNSNDDSINNDDKIIMPAK